MPLPQLNREQFERQYREALDAHRPETIDRLRQLLERPVPAEVSEATIEIFLDEYGGSPSVWMYFDGKNKRVSKTDQGIFAGRAMDLGLNLEAVADLDERYFNADFGAMNLAASLAMEWFAGCWRLVGGAVYPVRVTLSVHDGWGGGKPLLLTER